MRTAVGFVLFFGRTDRGRDATPPLLGQVKNFLFYKTTIIELILLIVILIVLVLDLTIESIAINNTVA